MPTLAPSEENGKKIPIAMTAAVTTSSGGEAVLWMNGILCVRIMCTISVCDSRLSMNQPDWNSDWCAGLLAQNTNHIRQKVVMSQTELLRAIQNLKRALSLAPHLLGCCRVSSSIRSHGRPTAAS